MRAIALALLLTGCAAPGVHMNDAERAACEAQGCTVWTIDELRLLVLRSIQRGIEMARGRAI